MTSHLKDKQLIVGQIGPMMRVNCAQRHRKHSEGFGPSLNVFYFHLPAFWRRNHELTIKECLQLLLHHSEVRGHQICQFDKPVTYNFRHQFGRNRGMPGPSIKAFWDLRDTNYLRLGRLLVTLGVTKVEGVGATRRTKLVTVIADTDVNVGTNAGRVNVPDATEETPSLVLSLGAEAEEYKGCGTPLAEMPWTEEETSEVLLWIDEMMVGIEFLIVQTRASVRESANWSDHGLEAVLITGLSDVAKKGRESWVEKPADKLLLVEHDGCSITKENQKLSSRGQNTTRITRNNGNKNHSDWKKRLHRTKRKCYATWMPRYTNKALITMQIQCRHGLRMCQSDISLDGNLPPCSRTMINTTNTNKLMQQRYTQPIRHERTPKTLETIAPSPNYGLDTAMALTEYDRPFVNGL